MEFHLFSDIWPLMEGAEFEELKADIRTNGVRIPVLTYQGKILDGRNRQRAGDAVGVTLRYEDCGVTDDDSALKLVVSLNDRRRHMSVAQRAFAAERLANIINGHNPIRSRTRIPDGISAEIPSGAIIPVTRSTTTRSLRRAADLLGVSHGSVQRARTIRTHGTETDVAEVISGRASLNARAAQVRAPRHAAPEPVAPRRARSNPLVMSDAPAVRDRTRLEIDPDWTDADGDWVTRHGHLTTMTAVQRASLLFNTATEELRAAVRKIQEMQPQISRQTIDDYWLRRLTNPSRRDVARLKEALDYLRPRIAEAEAALARATTVLAD